MLDQPLPAPDGAERDAARRDELAVMCRRLYARGWMEGTGGNLSVRGAGDRMLITASGRSKGELSADQIVEVRISDSRQASDEAHSPSRETALHQALYSLLPQCQAVVHAHAPHATVLATLARRQGKQAVVFRDYVIIEGIGPGLSGEVTVPVFANRFPVSDVAIDITARLNGGTPPVLLLADHGFMGWGPSLETARNRLECLEAMCRAELIMAGLTDPPPSGPARE